MPRTFWSCPERSALRAFECHEPQALIKSIWKVAGYPPQLALPNEPESEQMPSVGDAEQEVVAPAPRRGKRKPLSGDLPRIELIHELTCACGCRSM